MIGRRSLTTSPSRSTTSRSTPCVAGWCGPIFTVITSVRSASSAIVVLAVGEGHRLPADREVAPLRPAHVILGKEDPGQGGMAVEDDSEEVVGLPLLEVRSGEKLDAGVDFRKAVGRGATRGGGVFQKCLYTDALDSIPVKQLVVHREARLRRQVVGRVQAGEEAIALPGGVAQPGQHREDV